MEKSEVQQLLKKVKGTYGNKFEINEFTVDAWHDLLGKQSLGETLVLFSMYALKEKFPPNVSDLKVEDREKVVPMYVRPSS